MRFCNAALAAGATALAASTANAYFTVADNAPMLPTAQGGFMVQDATFSDSIGSDGAYFNGLGLAQGFTVSQSYSLDRLTVWGASDNFGNNRPWTTTALSSNITGLQVVLMKRTGDSTLQTLHTWNIGMASIAQSLTGNYTPNVFNPVFELGMNLAGGYSINAGTYYLSVGAVLANPDGDAFQWVNGQWDGADPSHQLLATVADTPTSWGQWSAVPDGTSSSMLIESNIPGPGTLAMLAAGALGSGRRRRR